MGQYFRRPLLGAANCSLYQRLFLIIKKTTCRRRCRCSVHSRDGNNNKPKSTNNSCSSFSNKRQYIDCRHRSLK